MNFKTVAKIIFFIQPTLRCIGGLQVQETDYVYLLLSCLPKPHLYRLSVICILLSDVCVAIILNLRFHK